MSERILKYTVSLFYTVFLLLLAYYSFTFKRADEIIYTLFLSSAFFIFSFLHRKYPGKVYNVFFNVLAASAFVLIVYGFFRSFSNPGLRLTGILGDRVFEADAAACIFAFFSAVFFITHGNRTKSAVSGAIVFLSSAYLSLLRVKTAYAAVILCILAITVFLFLKSGTDKTKKAGVTARRIILYLLLLIVSSGVPLISPYNQPPDRDSISKTVTGAFDFGSSTNKARLDFWNASLKMFSEKPFTGIGTGMWPGTYPKYNGAVYTDGNIDMNSALNPHNDYLRFLSEYGIAGIFYLLLAATGIALLFRKSFADISGLPLLLAALCPAVTSMFNFTYENIFALLVFVFCLSYAFNSGKDAKPTKRDFIVLITSVIIISAAVVLMITRFVYERDYEQAIQMKFRNDYRGALEKLSGINDVIYPADRNRMPLSYYAGTSYFELKDYGNALRNFDRASSLMPYFPAVMSNKASALYKTGHVQEAITLYRKTAEIFPGFFEPQINLLAVYANEKMHDEAKKLLTNIGSRITEPEFIKNYIVFLEIKNYYVKNGL